MADNKDFDFTIVDEIGILSTSSKGWTKELNLISWNGREPKYDIRDWAPDHEKMGKGVTLTAEEVDKLIAVLSTMDTGGDSKTSPTGAPLKENSIQELVDHWNDVVGRAPESIREYLMPSHLNEMNPDTVTVGLKKGTAFMALSATENKESLTRFVEQLIGRRINVELIESSWL